MDMARRLLFLMGLLILLIVVSTSTSTVSTATGSLSTAHTPDTTSDSTTNAGSATTSSSGSTSTASSGSATSAGSATAASSGSASTASSGSASTASSGSATAASSGSATDSTITASAGHSSTPTTASGGQDNSSTGGQASTDSTSISSTKGMDQCYNHTCVSNSTGCLKEAIDNSSVNTCPRGDEYCKTTKTTQNGQHTIKAECVSKSCEFDTSTSAANGEITFNCCQSDRCNTEDILKATATLLLPSCLLLSIVTLFTLVTSST